MINTARSVLLRPKGADRLRLRTLILLRWLAISGQIAAIGVARFYYGLIIPLGLCYLLVGASVIANLVSSFVFPESRRLSEREAMLVLLFDLAQLFFLLYLTGGLTNPFAMLIIAPVVISASALELRTTIILGAMAILLISLLAIFSIPMHLANGVVLSIPGLLEFGYWLSIAISILFIGLYSHRVSTEIQSMSNALLATQMALAREQKLTDLGGVVAATAHELGTPLATIMLVSGEMMEDLGDQPDLRDDAKLIRDQADRCRDILRSMGRVGKDDLLLRRALFEAVLKEAAEPHLGRGKEVVFDIRPAAGAIAGQPTIYRQPEIVHGIRNLVQNAVDFAATTVWIDGEWGRDTLRVRVIDDGPGYPPQLLGRIGDPFVRKRPAGQKPQQRPEYEGMGLGLFIAKTLLERSGAEISFANASDPFLTSPDLPRRRGAIVEVVWPLAGVVAQNGGILGKNTAIEI